MYKAIFLLGFMGSGKSTVGRQLADELGWQFVDTDVFIETRWRQRITDMFASVGEAGFRRRERMVIEELMTMEDTVFATGGGMPCYGDTMELLREAGVTIYFRCTPEVLVQRLELCKRTRPTIRDKSGAELEAFVRTTLLERAPIYTRAHYTYDIDEIVSPRMERDFARQLAADPRLRQPVLEG